MQNSTTPFIDLAVKQLSPLVETITRVPASNITEKDFQKALKQSFALLQIGDATGLTSAIEEKAHRAASAESLSRSVYDFEYYFSIQIDGKHYADMRIPNIDRVPSFSRAYAIKLAEGGEKNIPDFVLPMGHKLKTGVRLFHGGKWTIISGFDMDTAFLLANQATEYQAYIKRFPKTKAKTVQHLNVSYIVIDHTL